MDKINFELKDKEKIDITMGVGIKEIYPPIENLEVTPTKKQQIFTHENSYGYDNVIVEAISDEYIIPEGTLPITENATYDVRNFAKVSTSVYTVPNLQDKVVTPTKEVQTVEASADYDGLNKVTVNAIPNEYIVPSGELEITENGTYDVTNVANANVNVPTGGNTPEKGYVINEIDSNGYIKKATVYGLTTLPEYAFCGIVSNGVTYKNMLNKNLVEVILPNTMTSISKCCFYNCSMLQNVDMPDNITTINSSGFQGCSVLALTKLPNSLTTIGAQAFQSCKKLAIKTIPDGVKTLQLHTFNGCTSLTQISMRNVTTVYSGSSNNAFYNCTGLKAVWLGSAVTSSGLAQYSFVGCTNIAKMYIDLPRATVEAFTGYRYAFMNNTAKTGIIICNDDAGFITKEQFDATTF